MLIDDESLDDHVAMLFANKMSGWGIMPNDNKIVTRRTGKAKECLITLISLFQAALDAPTIDFPAGWSMDEQVEHIMIFLRDPSKTYAKKVHFLQPIIYKFPPKMWIVFRRCVFEMVMLCYIEKCVRDKEPRYTFREVEEQMKDCRRFYHGIPHMIEKQENMPQESD